TYYAYANTFDTYNISGDFENSGTITATATENAKANTIVIESISGNFTNSGTITATVTENSYANAFETDDISGDFTNTGTINAVGTKDSYVDAVEFENLFGSFNNSGTITATATEGRSGYALNAEDISENFTNSGRIVATATIDANANSVETHNIGGNFTNLGLISARATVGSRADAIDTRNISADFVNSGTIIAIANEDSASNAVQTRAISGDFKNTGTISAMAATGSKAVAVKSDSVSGDFTNSGEIIARVTASANSEAPRDDRKALGIYIEDLQGSFSNSGTIIAETDGAGTPLTAGVYLRELSGTIDRLGTIRASGDGDVYALYIENGAGTLNGSSADDVQGLIKLVGPSDATPNLWDDRAAFTGDVDLDARGGSAVFAFDDNTGGAATFTTTVSSKSSTWFVQDEGGTRPVYVAIDGADFAPSSALSAALGSAIGDSGAPSFGPAAQVTRGGTGSGLRPYAAFDLQYSELDEISGAETSVTLSNARFGLAGQMDTGAALRFGLGVISASGSGTGTEFDTTGYYLNATIGQTIGAFDLEAGIGFGWLSTDQTLAVGGIANPQSEYDSRIFTAHIAAERAFNVGQDFKLLGFANARYTSQTNEGYTATLGSASATIGEVTTDVMEVAVGATAQKQISDGGLLTAKLSGVWRQQLGDSDVDVSLFSTSETLSVASNDFKGARIEIGYEKDLSSGLQLQLNANQEIGANAQGPNIRVGLNWTF
ncbi:MAG: autotransporter outer membrane beta-barrel domain-containing protein, partial [Rhodobacteraceae bacterium]|nr:autotransporter outer membrane beta-barrel domain-containing protein [Paracoccaceae bacterium]